MPFIRTLTNSLELDLDVINLSSPSPELFDEVAQIAAKIVASNPDSNTINQIRRFYDELVTWDHQISASTSEKQELREAIRTSKYEECAPFIKMMNAKVAYAKGRNQNEKNKDFTGLVDKNFVDLFTYCIRKIDTYKSLKNCKLFFEAFIGFYKVERPKK